MEKVVQQLKDNDIDWNVSEDDCKEDWQDESTDYTAPNHLEMA